METTWIAETALLPTGWAPNVHLRVSAEGLLTGVTPADGQRPDPPGANRLHGAVIPAIPNVHSHAFQRGIVGLTERRGPATKQKDDFWSWREAMYDFVDRLDPDAVEAIATLVYAEMLSAGYGSVAEFHYVHHSRTGARYDDSLELSRRLIAAAERVGIRMTLVPVAYTAAGFDGAPLSAAQRRFSLTADSVLDGFATLNRDSKSATQAFGVGLHSLRAAPPDEVRRMADWLVAHPSVPAHIHVAEQPAEVAASLAATGARPVEWLLDHAPIDERWCLVHSTHTMPEERTRLATAGAVVGLCPTTEANLGDGTFPLQDFEAKGGRWAVGSDSQVSVNPADELRTLEYGQRLRDGSRVVVGRHGADDRSNGRALLDGTLEHAAPVLGQPVGGLAVGAAADLVVLDRKHPRLIGMSGDSIVDAWIFGADASVVRDVMVAGRWVVKEGRPPGWEDAVSGYAQTVKRLRA